jgi:hypothetical protein
MNKMKMKRIESTKIKVRQSDGYGIFHDSREDVRILGKALNTIIEKQNEIIEAVNKLIEFKNASELKQE